MDPEAELDQGVMEDEKDKSKWQQQYKPIEQNNYRHRKPRCTPSPNCRCIPKVKHRPCCNDDGCINFAMRMECPKTCPGRKGCKNRRLQLQQYPPLEVLEAGEKGWGLFVKKNIRKGEFIIEYVGDVINQKRMNKRKMKYEENMEKGQPKRVYFMQLNTWEYIDATKKGSVSRFINHSCEPNCLSQKWKVNGEDRIGIFAAQDIPENTELTFDYGWKLGSHLDPRTVCHCGTKTCKGTIELVPPKPEVVRTGPPRAFEPGKGRWRTPNDEDKKLEEKLVGRRIRVYWQGNMEFFEAEVKSYDHENGEHELFYMDHTLDRLFLSEHTWEILDEEKESYKIGKKSRTPSPVPVTTTLPPPERKTVSPMSKGTNNMEVEEALESEEHGHHKTQLTEEQPWSKEVERGDKADKRRKSTKIEEEIPTKKRRKYSQADKVDEVDFEGHNRGIGQRPRENSDESDQRFQRPRKGSDSSKPERIDPAEEMMVERLPPPRNSAGSIEPGISPSAAEQEKDLETPPLGAMFRKNLGAGNKVASSPERGNIQRADPKSTGADIDDNDMKDSSNNQAHQQVLDPAGKNATSDNRTSSSKDTKKKTDPVPSNVEERAPKRHAFNQSEPLDVDDSMNPHGRSVQSPTKPTYSLESGPQIIEDQEETDDIQEPQVPHISASKLPSTSHNDQDDRSNQGPPHQVFDAKPTQKFGSAGDQRDARDGHKIQSHKDDGQQLEDSAIKLERKDSSERTYPAVPEKRKKIGLPEEFEKKKNEDDQSLRKEKPGVDTSNKPAQSKLKTGQSQISNDSMAKTNPTSSQSEIRTQANRNRQDSSSDRQESSHPQQQRDPLSHKKSEQYGHQRKGAGRNAPPPDFVPSPHIPSHKNGYESFHKTPGLQDKRPRRVDSDQARYPSGHGEDHPSDSIHKKGREQGEYIIPPSERAPPHRHDSQWKDPNFQRSREPPARPPHEAGAGQRSRNPLKRPPHPDEQRHFAPGRESPHHEWREAPFPRKHDPREAAPHLSEHPRNADFSKEDRLLTTRYEEGTRLSSREREAGYGALKDPWHDEAFPRGRDATPRHQEHGIRQRSRDREFFAAHDPNLRDPEFSRHDSGRMHDKEGRVDRRESQGPRRKDQWNEPEYSGSQLPRESLQRRRSGHPPQEDWGDHYLDGPPEPVSRQAAIDHAHPPSKKIRYDWKEDARGGSGLRRTVSDPEWRFPEQEERRTPRGGARGPLPPPSPRNDGLHPPGPPSRKTSNTAHDRRQNLPKHLVPCFFYSQNKCRNGRNCEYLHDDSNRSSAGDDHPPMRGRPKERWDSSRGPPEQSHSYQGPPPPPYQDYRDDLERPKRGDRDERANFMEFGGRERGERGEWGRDHGDRERGRSRSRDRERPPPHNPPPRGYPDHFDTGPPPPSNPPYNRVPPDHAPPPGPPPKDHPSGYHPMERNFPERRSPVHEPPLPPPPSEPLQRRRLPLPVTEGERASDSIVEEEKPVTVTMMVPTSTVRHLIGKSGRCVTAMKEMSGANIQILSKDNEVPPPAETEVVITGLTKQILHAKNIIKENITKALQYIEQGRGSNENRPSGVAGGPAAAPPLTRRTLPVPIPNEGDHPLIPTPGQQPSTSHGTTGQSHQQREGSSLWVRGGPGAGKIKGRRRQRPVMGVDWYSFPLPEDGSVFSSVNTQKDFQAKKTSIRIMKDTARELSIPISVVLHGSILFHRYCTIRHPGPSHLLDSVLACFHLANKSQKVQSCRKLAKLLHTSLGLQARHSHTPLPDEHSPELADLKARVLAEESKILACAQYDLSFPDACVMLRLMTRDNPLLQSMMPRFEMFLGLACPSVLWLHFQPKCMLAAIIVAVAGQVMCGRANEDERGLDRDLMGAVHSQVVMGLIFKWELVRQAARLLGDDLVQIHGAKKLGDLDMEWVLKQWEAFLKEEASVRGGSLLLGTNRGELVSRLGSAQSEYNSLAQLAPPMPLGDGAFRDGEDLVFGGAVLAEQLTLERRLSPHLAVASVDSDLLESLCEGLPRYLQQAELMEATLPHADRVRVYLLRWPSEHTATGKEELSIDARLSGANLEGFAPMALQELALFQYLHGLCANLTSGAPIVTPIAPVLGTRMRSVGQASRTDRVSQDSSDPEFQRSQQQREFEKDNYFIIEPSPHILQNAIRHARTSPLPRRLVRHLLRGLLEAVRFCHDRNVVLRAIDMERVFITGQGEVKVAGLGAAVCVLSASLTAKNQLVSATPASSHEHLNRKLLVHKAPELLLGQKNYTVATDMWAVGSIACQLALGNPFIQAKNFHQHVEYVFRSCGSPSEDNWPDGMSMPLYEKHKSQQSYKPRVEKQLRQLLGQQSSLNPSDSSDDDRLVSFLASMLRLDPGERPSAKVACNHDFLQRYPGDEMQAEEVLLWMNENLKTDLGRPPFQTPPPPHFSASYHHNQIPLDGAGGVDKPSGLLRASSVPVVENKQMDYDERPYQSLPPKIPAPPPPPGASSVS